MEFKQNFFRNYLLDAPLSLAIERSLESQILIQKKFIHPILDIGCGEGIFAYHLFDGQIDVSVEPNQKELQRAKTFNVYGELINCFGDRISKPDKTFKTIFSNSVFEHIPDIKGVLRESHRLLCDDGVIYLTLPTNLFEKYTIM